MGLDSFSTNSPNRIPANFEQVKRTKTQNFAKLELTKHNAVKLGGDFTADQRLSGLS